MFAAEAALLQRSWAQDLEEQPGLVRVVSGSRALRCCGSILRRPTSAETYEASWLAESVDYFVSHSQQTNWAPKAWALLYTMNVIPAVVVAVVSDFIISKWFEDQFGWLRSTIWFLRLGSVTPIPIPVSVSFGMACFILVVMMFLAPYVPGLLRRRLFIDKCCVAQDAESQLKAIRQLRSTLQRSKKMILLWEPTYFDSLPCVHELATFLHVHKDCNSSHRVDVVPVCMPLLTAALFVFHTFATTAWCLLGPCLIASEWHITWVATKIPGLAEWPYIVSCWFVICFFGLFLAPSFFLWNFATKYMKQRRRLQEQLSNFSVEKSRCFLETHRQVLVADIAAQFGSVAAFESFIRKELPRSIPVLRQAPVPLLTAMVGAISHLFLGTKLTCSALQEGQPAIAANFAVAAGVVMLCTDSLALNLVLLLAEKRNAEAEEEGEAPSFCRRMLEGPLSAATIFASLTALPCSVMVVGVPMYAAVPAALGMLVPVVVLYRRNFAPAGVSLAAEKPPAAEEPDVEFGSAAEARTPASIAAVAPWRSPAKDTGRVISSCTTFEVAASPSALGAEKPQAFCNQLAR